MTTKSVLLGLLLLFAVQANAQQDVIRANYEKLHQGDFNGAYREFRAMSDRDPENLASALGLLMAMYDRGLDDAPLQKEYEQRLGLLLQKTSKRYENNKG